VIGMLVIGPIRAAPIPRHPAARIKRAYKLRQQPAETPAAWTARGLFFVTVKASIPNHVEIVAGRDISATVTRGSRRYSNQKRVESEGV
jgi:hypothetical protein